MPPRNGSHFLEGRIGEISYKLGVAKVIDPESVLKGRGAVRQPGPGGESGFGRAD